MTSDLSEPTVRVAPAPFDDPSADVVLRMPDNIEFRVFRWFLRGISPAFEAHLQSRAQTKSEPDSDNLNAILRSLSEPSKTIELLLRQYYPFPEPLTFSSYENGMEVLLAAHKLQFTRIAPVLAEAARPHIKENPLRAYGFALRHGMKDMARLAAHEFLAVEDTLMDSDELDSMTVRQYRHLVVYRQACAGALKIFTDTTKDTYGRLCVWTPDEMKGEAAACWHRCGRCVRDYGHPAKWFCVFYERIGERLRARPTADAVSDPKLLVPAIQEAVTQCSGGCGALVYTQLHRYRELMLEEIERRIAEVPLELV